jgi:RimJ/RimL family protein N-acetyltransferase/glycosyltransferase involved in cell wall biosynthesis
VNILIRPLTIEDAAVSYKWRNDPEVWKFTGSRPTKAITAEIERDWLKNSLGDKSKTRFAILVDGEYVGNVQLTDIILNKTAEFHIFIGNKSFWGKGVAKEATYQILQYAKEVLNLQSVFLDVNKENLPAIKSYKKNGFVIVNETNDSIRMVCDIQNLKPPMVSVFCMVYNQEQYISQAIEGFLMQKTNFTSVMVVGEDCSTDGSRYIILEYAKKYPGKFKLLLNDKNIGAHKNQEKVLKNCTGKYIAMCEGDDYWTDPLKLQKQVGFMEANAEYGICFHNVRQENDFNNKTHIIPGVKQDKDFTLNEYVLNNKTATCSLVFRSDVFNSSIPKWFAKLPFGDLGLILMALKKYNEKGMVLSDEMGVYRVHHAGTHGSFHKNDKGLINAYKQHWVFTNIIKKELLFEPRYKSILQKKKINTLEILSDLNKKENHYIGYFSYRILLVYYKVMSKLL